MDPSTRIRTTISTTPEYVHRLASISSRASLTDPLNTIFQVDKLGPSAELTLDNLYQYTLARINQKIKSGSLIIEANDFTAVACLEPPDSVAPSRSEEELKALEKARPIYAHFNRTLETFRKVTLGQEKFWQMSLLARDPNRPGKGAVRAIIEELQRKAKEERVAVWCVAGNEKARGVYEFFGFRGVGVVELGGDVRAWCMIWKP